MSTILPNTDHGLLTKDNSALVFIDHQPQMTFGVANIDRQLLKNNVQLLAKAAKLYGVPTILTTGRAPGPGDRAQLAQPARRADSARPSRPAYGAPDR